MFQGHARDSIQATMPSLTSPPPAPEVLPSSCWSGLGVPQPQKRLRTRCAHPGPGRERGLNTEGEKKEGTQCSPKYDEKNTLSSFPSPKQEGRIPCANSFSPNCPRSFLRDLEAQSRSPKVPGKGSMVPEQDLKN